MEGTLIVFGQVIPISRANLHWRPVTLEIRVHTKQEETRNGQNPKVSLEVLPEKFGGADRDRTDDLNTASVALSQLSYGPIIVLPVGVGFAGAENTVAGPRLASKNRGRR